MLYYRPFRDVIPHSKVGHPRVTHPFATLLTPFGVFAFDLHVLGTPPALILSQDQTLMFNSFRLRACALRRDKQTLKPDCFGSCVVLTSLSSSWVVHRSTPGPNQNQIALERDATR